MDDDDDDDDNDVWRLFDTVFLVLVSPFVFQVAAAMDQLAGSTKVRDGFRFPQIPHVDKASKASNHATA